MTKQPHPGWAFIADAARYEGQDCLLWPYGKTQDGYGRLGNRKGDMYTNRLICTAAHGPRPSAKHEAAHSCRTRLCCNPAHLRWATSKENNGDQLLHGTRRRGERHYAAKLTVEQVLEIRAASSGRGLGRKYHVAQDTIAQIRAGKRWSWVTRND